MVNEGTRPPTAICAGHCLWGLVELCRLNSDLHLSLEELLSTMKHASLLFLPQGLPSERLGCNHHFTKALYILKLRQEQNSRYLSAKGSDVRLRGSKWKVGHT